MLQVHEVMFVCFYILFYQFYIIRCMIFIVYMPDWSSLSLCNFVNTNVKWSD